MISASSRSLHPDAPRDADTIVLVALTRQLLGTTWVNPGETVHVDPHTHQVLLIRDVGSLTALPTLRSLTHFSVMRGDVASLPPRPLPAPPSSESGASRPDHGPPVALLR